MMRILAVLICAGLATATIWILTRFADYTGRRVAQADVISTVDLWLMLLLAVAVVSIGMCAALCCLTLQIIGGFPP
jgi:ABC-type proline/glycine betaine transport system permease subunit